MSALAAAEQVSPAQLTRVLRLAFLAPAVMNAILAGTLRTGVDAAALTAPSAVARDWRMQAAALLPVR